MIIEELSNYCKTLKEKLTKLKKELEEIVKQLIDLEELINGCSTVKQYIDELVFCTLDTASKKFENEASPNFREYYLRNINKIINGQEVNNAIANIDAIKKKANTKYIENEQEKNKLNSDIETISAEINDVSVQMLTEGDGENA